MLNIVRKKKKKIPPKKIFKGIKDGREEEKLRDGGEKRGSCRTKEMESGVDAERRRGKRGRCGTKERGKGGDAGRRRGEKGEMRDEGEGKRGRCGMKEREEGEI